MNPRLQAGERRSVLVSRPGINVFTLDPHARRSAKVLAKVYSPDAEAGVIDLDTSIVTIE